MRLAFLVVAAAALAAAGCAARPPEPEPHDRFVFHVYSGNCFPDGVRLHRDFDRIFAELDEEPDFKDP